MDKYANLIKEAIYELFQKGCYEKHISVYMSELVFKQFYRWSIEKVLYHPNDYMKMRFMGCEVVTTHPYNEVVVCHRDCSYNPLLVIRIPIEGFDISKVKELK